jgi:Polyketide cyclase / dehydrase and lipid transport
MPTVRAASTFPGSVHEAETLWYDTSRWPSWIDGLAHVDRVEGEWPRIGAKVIWDSVPAGRGRVVERVSGYEALNGQTLDVEDEQILGTQSVAFTPVDGDVQVQLSLAYRIKNRSIITPLLDLLFIRRAMASSLDRTVVRFGVELAAERELHTHLD